MDWTKRIEEQLNVRYKPDLRKRISYYESQPLKQIQMDTSFFTLPLTTKQIPVLVIVDVATKYVRYYQQSAKNDKVSTHLKAFMKDVKKKFKGSNISDDTVLITDGAKELAIKSIPGVRHYVSTSKNKAAVAESAIARARRIFRKKENSANVLNIRDGDNSHYIEFKDFQKHLDKIAKDLNVTAKIKPPPVRPDNDTFYDIGTPVLAVNMAKFYSEQVGEGLKKQSYQQNWLYEPFWISDYKKVQNIYKYTLTAFEDNLEAKYYFYSDQIQQIDPEIADLYVSLYLRHINIK